MNERPSVLKIQDANRNFSRVEACARETGSVVLTMYRKPKYLVLDLEKTSIIEMTDKEKIEFVARRILDKHRHAFEELAR